MSGDIGINYAHELMHQTTRLERWLGDLLLASVLYGHFRSPSTCWCITAMSAPRATR